MHWRTHFCRPIKWIAILFVPPRPKLDMPPIRKMVVPLATEDTGHCLCSPQDEQEEVLRRTPLATLSAQRRLMRDRRRIYTPPAPSRLHFGIPSVVADHVEILIATGRLPQFPLRPVDPQSCVDCGRVSEETDKHCEHCFERVCKLCEWKCQDCESRACRYCISLCCVEAAVIINDFFRFVL